MASETYEGESLANLADAISNAVIAFASQIDESVTGLAEVSEYEHASSCIRPQEWYMMQIPGHAQEQLLLIQRMFTIDTSNGSHLFAHALIWNEAPRESEGCVLRIPVNQYKSDSFTPQIIQLSSASTCMHHEMHRSGEEIIIQPTFS